MLSFSCLGPVCRVLTELEALGEIYPLVVPPFFVLILRCGRGGWGECVGLAGGDMMGSFRHTGWVPWCGVGWCVCGSDACGSETHGLLVLDALTLPTAHGPACLPTYCPSHVL